MEKDNGDDWRIGERNPADNTIHIYTDIPNPNKSQLIAKVSPWPHYDDRQKYTAEVIRFAPEMLRELEAIANRCPEGVFPKLQLIPCKLRGQELNTIRYIIAEIQRGS